MIGVGRSLSIKFQDNERVMVDWATQVRTEWSRPPLIRPPLIRAPPSIRPARKRHSVSSTSSTTTDSEDNYLPTGGRSISKVAVRSSFIDFES